jgi:hypothetical protein
MKDINIELTLGELYLNILTALGCTVDDTGAISFYGNIIKSDEDDELPFLLPVKNNIKDVDVLDKTTGKFVKSKQLFNPLDENSLNDTTPTLRMMKRTALKRINYLVVGCMGLLLKLGTNNLANTSALNVNLNKYIESINGLIRPNMVSVIDDKTEGMFKSLTDAIINIDGGFMKCFIKNNGLIGDTKYFKVTTLYSDLYKMFYDAEGDKVKIAELNTYLREKYGVKLNLRPKDVSVFIIIMKNIAPDIRHDGNIYYGSIDQETPSVCSLWSCFYDMVSNTNSIAAGLATSFPTLATELIIDLSDVPSSLDGLAAKYKDELQYIPRDSRRAIRTIGGPETVEKIEHVRIAPKIPGLGERLSDTDRNTNTARVIEPEVVRSNRATAGTVERDTDPLSRLVNRGENEIANGTRYIGESPRSIRPSVRDVERFPRSRDYGVPRMRDGYNGHIENIRDIRVDDRFPSRYGRGNVDRYNRRYDRVLGDDLLY